MTAAASGGVRGVAPSKTIAARTALAAGVGVKSRLVQSLEWRQVAGESRQRLALDQRLPGQPVNQHRELATRRARKQQHQSVGRRQPARCGRRFPAIRFEIRSRAFGFDGGVAIPRQKPFRNGAR